MIANDCWCRWSHMHAPKKPSMDVPVFLISLPQSEARRAAFEPAIRTHASNVTLVQPYDGRRRRFSATPVAAPSCSEILTYMCEQSLGNNVSSQWRLSWRAAPRHTGSQTMRSVCAMPKWHFFKCRVKTYLRSSTWKALRSWRSVFHPPVRTPQLCSWQCPCLTSR